MKENQDNRRPEEIEHDIDRTRAEMSHTIDEIQARLTPGQMMDQAFTYARTSLPADFGTNLGNAVRDNPMPVALIGIGVAWLMMQGQNSDGRARQRRRAAQYDRAMESNRDYYSVEYGTEGDTSGSQSGRVHRVVSKVGEKSRNLKDQASDTSQRVMDKASDTGHRLMDKASEIGSRISDTASSVADRARETASGARDRMSSARGRVSESAGSVRARAGDLSDRSQQQYYRAKDGINRLMDEQPLMLGALGAAIGTLLGAALPATRREDEFMGHHRDRLMDTAKETAREHAETVKESAKRVAEVAQREAQNVAKQATESTSGGNGLSQSPGTSAESRGQQSLH